MTPEGLAELLRLCEAATPGPWRWDEEIGALEAGELNGEHLIWPQNSLAPEDAESLAQQLGACGDKAELDAEANAAFIVTAREAVPDLLAENEAQATQFAESEKVRFDLMNTTSAYIAENERLREALQPFAEAAVKYDIWRDDEFCDHGDYILVRDLRRAAAALAGTSADKPEADNG